MNNDPIRHPHRITRGAIVALALALTLPTTALAWVGAPVSVASPGGSASYDTASPPTALSDAVRSWAEGKKAQAVRSAHRAMRVSLRKNELITALGIACQGKTDLGRPEAAIPFCTRAVSLTQTQDWRSLSHRGNAHLQSGRLEEAIADYEAALALRDTEGDRVEDPLFADSETHETVEASLADARGQLATVVHPGPASPAR
jgi:tetratricopeptide (TPR) repeat protein